MSVIDSTKIKIITASINNYSNHVFFEGGVFMSEKNHGPFLNGLRLTGEFGIVNNNFYVAPKIGYEYTPLIFSIRTSIANYTNFKSNDLRLQPQFGLGFLVFYFYYSINIPICSERIHFIPKNNLSLTVNLFPSIYKRKKK